MGTLYLEPDSLTNVLDLEYLGNIQVQRFMSKFNLTLTERVLQRINRYITLLVSDLFKDIPLSAPPTVPQFRNVLESLMDSNLTYWSIIRAVSFIQDVDCPEEPTEPSPTSKKLTLSNLFGFPFLRQKLSHKKKSPKGVTRKNTAPELYRVPSPIEEPMRKTSLCDLSPIQTFTVTRSKLCMVGPWQIMYHCEMGSNHNSPELLAHIEMTEQVLEPEVASFLGIFLSQLIQAMLKELARVALISKLTSITISLVDEAFHPQNSYMPLKFPMLSKLKLRAVSGHLHENHAITPASPEPCQALPEESFVPAYISKSAAETLLVRHATTPGLTQQGLFLVNQFLDEVVLSLSRKLVSKKLTLSQLIVALNLSLKSCPLIKETIKSVTRKFPSILAVPVRPLVSSGRGNSSCPSIDASLFCHHYRLLAHYYSPHSELYQSRRISDFFKTQPFVLNIEVSRYLAAIIAQLGLSVIRDCADSLLERQNNLQVATNVMGTHLMVPTLSELIPECTIFKRLKLHNFPHVDPTPDQLATIYPASPATPSLRFSDETITTCTSSRPNSIHQPPIKSKGKGNKHNRLSRSVSLAQLRIPTGGFGPGDPPLLTSASLSSSFLHNRPSMEFKRGTNFLLSLNRPLTSSRTIDSAQFDSILQDNSTLKLSITPTRLAAISDEV